MKLRLDIGVSQLNKHGEELCGDSVEVARSEDRVVIVLSDGLGSGVKANILSSLTAKMAATMLKEGLGLDEVIETLAHTLPVCEVRHLAYSTFAILQVFRDGRAYLAEYDTPEAIIGRGQDLRHVPRNERKVGDKVIREAFFDFAEGDWAVLVSDGVLHAGIGGVWNLGWGWERVANYVRIEASKGKDAESLAAELARVCDKLYASRPGDDATCVAIRVRTSRSLTMLVGPPADPRDDVRVVDKLMSAEGKKAVCGGTTGNLVARELGVGISVDLKSMDKRVPPTGIIEGIDLVTEGMLTLSYALDMIKAGVKADDLAFKRDGASRLALLLLESDEIRIMVGRAINPAHQSPDVPPSLALKHKIVDELARVLRDLGKMVEVEYY